MVCDGASGRSNCDGLESRRGGRQEGRRWEGGQKEEEEGEEEIGRGKRARETDRDTNHHLQTSYIRQPNKLIPRLTRCQ